MSPTRFRLQDEIDRKGTTQSALARDSGVSFATISRMCRNTTAQVSLETLDKLAAALEIAPGDLLEAEPKGRRAR